MSDPLSKILSDRIDAALQNRNNPYAAFFSALSIARLLYGPSSPQIEALAELKRLIGTPLMQASGITREAQHAENLEENNRRELFEMAFSGFMAAMHADLKAGLIGSLESTYQGQVFGDFVVAAKSALDNGAKEPAAVLACAALEDSLKRYAEMNGINVGGREMQDVINALKGKGLISGPQKGIVDAFPRLRNAAMHAEWDKIQPEDVRSAIGFVEQFLMTRFGSINLPSP